MGSREATNLELRVLVEERVCPAELVHSDESEDSDELELESCVSEGEERLNVEESSEISELEDSPQAAQKKRKKKGKKAICPAELDNDTDSGEKDCEKDHELRVEVILDLEGLNVEEKVCPAEDLYSDDLEDSDDLEELESSCVSEGSYAVCPAELDNDTDSGSGSFEKECSAELEHSDRYADTDSKLNTTERKRDCKFFKAVKRGHKKGGRGLLRLKKLKNEFGYSTDKVNKKGQNKKGEYTWGPLQLAAAFGDVHIVKELCKYTRIDLVQPDDDGDTPLHAAAYWDHDSTIEIILNTAKDPVMARRAINTSNTAKETPFTFAATRYHKKSCAMMIRYSPPLAYTFPFVHPGRNPGTKDVEKETDSGIFGKLRTKEAVNNFEKMNEHIIKYHKRNGQGKTSINIMITKMPELVFEILDKSIIRTKTTVLTKSSKGSENKQEDIQRVIVDFGALENYGEEEKGEEEEPKNSEVLGKNDEKKPFVTVNVEEEKKTKKEEEKNKKEEEENETKNSKVSGKKDEKEPFITVNVEIEEEEEKEKKTKKEEERDKKEEEETGKPLTSGHYKHGSNPLQIMAKMNHSLLTHPVVEALIVTKWEKFARTYFYIFTFLLYLIFFSVLMGYQFTQIKPFELLENDKAIRSWIGNASHTCDEFPDGCSKKKSAESDIFGYILLVMSAIRLFLELLDLLDNVFNSDLDSGSNSPLETGKAWLQGLMNYLIDPENYLEVILYGSCLFFSLNVLEPQSVMSPFHWKIGSLSVLTSFINLLLILQVFPNIGIYIIMFFKIAWTFLSKILSLLVFFLIAFMVVFHMLLSHTNVFRNILSADAIFKTLSAGVSGVEYDDYADQEMIYPTTTLVGLIAFALFVQVLFLNLATALAIGDVDSIRSGAEKAKNALKIKHIYNAQRIANLVQWVAKPIFCGSALNVLEHQKRFRNMPAKRFKEDRLAYIETCTEKYSTESEKSEITYTKKCTGKCTEKSENVVIPFSDFYKKHYKGE